MSTNLGPRSFEHMSAKLGPPPHLLRTFDDFCSFMDRGPTLLPSRTCPKERFFLLYPLFLGQNVEPAPIPFPLPPPGSGTNKEEENQQTEEDCIPEGSSQEQKVPGKDLCL